MRMPLQASGIHCLQGLRDWSVAPADAAAAVGWASHRCAQVNAGYSDETKGVGLQRRVGSQLRAWGRFLHRFLVHPLGHDGSHCSRCY